MFYYSYAGIFVCKIPSTITVLILFKWFSQLFTHWWAFFQDKQRCGTYRWCVWTKCSGRGRRRRQRRRPPRPGRTRENASWLSAGRALPLLYTFLEGRPPPWASQVAPGSRREVFDGRPRVPKTHTPRRRQLNPRLSRALWKSAASSLSSHCRMCKYQEGSALISIIHLLSIKGVFFSGNYLWKLIGSANYDRFENFK